MPYPKCYSEIKIIDKKSLKIANEDSRLKNLFCLQMCKWTGLLVYLWGT